jgi:hypothetical protein
VLASILPGLREIRAPLAAGYLWLVIGWLLLHDRVETGSSASGAVDALTDLRDAIGVGGLAAAATFVAYLLGALWEPLSLKVAEYLWGAWSWRQRPKAPPFEAPRFEDLSPIEELSIRRQSWLGDVITGVPWHHPPLNRVSDSAWTRLWGIGRRFISEIDESLSSRLGSSFDPEATSRSMDELAPTLLDIAEADPKIVIEGGTWEQEEMRLSLAQPRLTREQVQEAISRRDELELTSPRDAWWLKETADFVPQEARALDAYNPYRTVVAFEAKVGHFRYLTDAHVAKRLFDELPSVERRLVGEQQELALEASRTKGEVEFRYALAIPLPIAVGVLAFGLGLPWWAWVAATVGGVVAGLALLTDGWRLDEARNDSLVELLAIGKAKSPTFERLAERATQVSFDASASPVDEVGVREGATV